MRALPDGYHTAARLDAEIDAAIRAAGTRAEARLFGTSVEGRPLRAVTVSAPGRGAGHSSSHVLVIANLHGVEVISSELALAVLGDLCHAPGLPHVQELLDVCDVTVVPVMNPDAREVALRNLDAGGVFAAAPRRNARGVDLNRNWPFPRGAVDHWLPLAGTSMRRLPWYRGDTPLSEPETAALAGLAHAIRPVGLLNLHSTGQILTYPWSSMREPTRDAEGFRRMIAAFRAHQTRWSYRAKQSRNWYPIVGSSNDWFYETFGTLAVTVELAPSGAALAQSPRLAMRPFWAANPLDPVPHVENNRIACLAALRAAYDWRSRHRVSEG